MARALRRTWFQRIVIGSGCIAVALFVAAAAGLGWFYWRFNQIPVFSFGEGTLAKDLGGPLNFLLVGSDSAAGLGEADPETAGRSGVTGQRADTIIVLRVNPQNTRAAMLSIPRDTYLPLAGQNRSGRVNEAFELGPEQLIRTISQHFQIPIHHYVQVDFAGFKGLVNVVKGVPVFFPSPARDSETGLRIDTPGCHKLDGQAALAYVRSRHYEYLEGGVWREQLAGDLDRIDRQQDFIRRAAGKMLKLRLNVSSVNRIASLAVKYVKRDSSLGLDKVLALGDRFRSLDPALIETYELPTFADYRAGALVQVALDDRAAPILQRFRGQPPPARPSVPSAVRVRVLNGTGARQQATLVKQALEAVGFRVDQPGDLLGHGQVRTQIRFGNGQRAAAVLLARHLASSAELVEDPAVVGVDVVLITGRDFTNVTRNPGRPPKAPAKAAPRPPTTTTTLPQNAPPGPPC